MWRHLLIWLQRLSQARGIALAYFVVASITILFTRFNGGLALVWPATGVLLAYLLSSTPARRVPALWACCTVSVIATSIFGFGPLIALPLAILNVAEAWLIMAVLDRTRPQRDYFESLRGLTILVIVAGLAVPAVCAVPGAAFSWIASGRPFGEQWVNWLAGHGLGTLLVTPIALFARRGEIAGWISNAGPVRRGEAMLLLTIVAAFTAATFTHENLPILFLPFLPMMIATCRLGRLGASLSALLLSVIAAALTLNGQGPIWSLEASVAFRSQYLQFYLATALLLVLPAAAVLKERSNLLSKLREEQAIHRLLAENSGDIMLSLSRAGEVRFVSPSAREVLGHEPAAIVGENILRFVDRAHMGRVLAARQDALATPGRTVRLETRSAPVEGPALWLETKIRAVADDNGGIIGLVCSVRDISERKAAERELTRAANTDALTGLANRRAFMASLAQTLYAARTSGVGAILVLVDIDHFKSVNDRYGHATGDEVLRSVAALGTSLLTEKDMMARIGGEEFALLLHGLTLDQACMLCERLRAEIESSTVFDGRRTPFNVTISLGLGRLEGSETLAQAMEAADEALYRAKRQGRNQLRVAGPAPPGAGPVRAV